MQTVTNRRSEPRLRLAYPIRLDRDDGAGAAIGRNVTQDVSARGAYFTTFDGGYTVGQRVTVTISVPHRLSHGGGDLVIDLRGPAEIVRVDGADAVRRFGEDGLPLTGVAVAFGAPLAFRTRWV